ncbi:hypothetical protein BDD12DRAFT_830769, partial [Trichophaea hybrida]
CTGIVVFLFFWKLFPRMFVCGVFFLVYSASLTKFVQSLPQSDFCFGSCAKCLHMLSNLRRMVRLM